MTSKIYQITRDLTPEECHWLDATIPKGTLVYDYTGPTYGCVSNTGKAVMLTAGAPFVEVPRNAIASFTGFNTHTVPWRGKKMRTEDLLP